MVVSATSGFTSSALICRKILIKFSDVFMWWCVGVFVVFCLFKNRIMNLKMQCIIAKSFAKFSSFYLQLHILENW